MDSISPVLRGVFETGSIQFEKRTAFPLPEARGHGEFALFLQGFGQYLFLSKKTRFKLVTITWLPGGGYLGCAFPLKSDWTSL